MVFAIIRTIAELSNTGTNVKRLAIVSWNGAPGKLDLRNWRIVDGEEVPGRGCTLTYKEAHALAEALTVYLEDA